MVCSHGTRSPVDIYEFQLRDARIFECDCMYISMSFHYSKYEFVGPESELERYRFRSASSSSLSVCFNDIFRRRERPKAISVETYQ